MKHLNELIAVLFIAGSFLGCGQSTKFRSNRQSIKPYDGEITRKMDLIDLSFGVAETDVESISVNKTSDTLEHEFGLEVAPAKSSFMTQVNRQIAKENFTQGRPGDSQTESFSFREAGLLDLLVVVDNSSSMEPYQDLLASNLSSLLQHVASTNWQIAVVTTDSSCVRDVITAIEFANDQTDAEARFINAVQVGSRGSPRERGIEMAIKGMTGECRSGNRNWMRPRAKFATLILSDEENCGSARNEGCNTPNYPKFGPDDFIAAAPIGSRVYGILYDPNICPDDGYDINPDEYYELVSRTGGLWEPICQQDYSNTLSAISKDVGEVLKQEFVLNYSPDAILSVKIDDVPTTNYTVVGNVIKLNDTVPLTAELFEIEYQYGEVERYKDFTLSGSPDPATVKIKIEGIEVDPSTYQYSGTSKIVSFAALPADGVVIEVSYRNNEEELSTVFGLDDDEIIEHSMVVKVNGVIETNYAFDSNNHTITFSSAPPDGASIEMIYNLPEDLTRTYKIPVISGLTIADFAIYDASTGDRLGADISGDEIILDLEDVYLGRRVLGYFTTEASLIDRIVLPNDPIDQNVSIEVDEDIFDCKSQYVVNSRNVFLACSEEQPERVTISYRYIKSFNTFFRVPGFKEENPTWRVWVDDKEIKDFRVYNQEVVEIQAELLKADSLVRITVAPAIVK